MGKDKSIPIQNPFEGVTAEQLNSDQIAYLFAKPEEAVYSKLTNRENYRIIGGWGSGKTMLLKYISFETQIEVMEVAKLKKVDIIGLYIKAGPGPFKPFLRPGGEFKEGGENLFGHYLNLLILEKTLAVILSGKNKSLFNISSDEETNLANSILSKFSSVTEEPQIGFHSNEVVDILNVKKKIESWRLEIETFLNTRDLEKELSYETQLSVLPSNIQTFLEELFKDIKDVVSDLSKKRFYILLDECEQFSKGQQKVINTIIKRRPTTMVFKLASRPPDIKTMETVNEEVGLTDREIKKLHLDEMYNPTSASYRNLCYRVAKKRLEKYGYPMRDIRKILGKYTVENEVGKDNIASYLKEKYPNKNRVKNKFNKIYRDFKVAATFQILRQRKTKKKYAGFETFTMLSSGIMVHFLELCRETFNSSFVKYIVRDQKENIVFKKIPLPVKIQSDAAQRVSEEFYRDAIPGRSQSLKDTRIDMEFGGKIQYFVSVLTGIFREKLTTFNEPEAARVEIPEGISTLDDSLENPIQQIFETAISISVFQESKPYMPKRFGGIRPPTYILNRILAPYPKRISPRPRWRTTIPVEIFNKILKLNSDEFRREVFGKNKKRREKVEVEQRTSKRKKKTVVQVDQLVLPFSQVAESMPVISYISKKIQDKPFKGKTLIVLLHFLRDLVPFIDGCKKAGADPSNTVMFYKDYQYPNREEVEHHFKENAYREIYPLVEVDTVLKQLQSKDIKDIIVVEDGGHIVPKLHFNEFKNLAKTTLGAVEQTTRGIREDEQINSLLFPVVSIPGSDIKNTFEPPHVARAVVSNIQKLLSDINLSGRKALVIGFGSIGEQVVLQLRDTLKMQVSIYDSDSTKLLKAHQSGFDTEENLREGVKEKTLIIGCTGQTVIGRSEILVMDHNVYLVSASSEQWEFCISELDALSSERYDLSSDGVKIGTRYKITNTEKYVNLVADGYPINFWKRESMPNEVSDLIMSLIFISAIEIARNPSLSPRIDDEIVNELSKRYELDKIYLEYHR